MRLLTDKENSVTEVSMILVVGGFAQGKLDYVLGRTGYTEKDVVILRPLRAAPCFTGFTMRPPSA